MTGVQAEELVLEGAVVPVDSLAPEAGPLKQFLLHKQAVSEPHPCLLQELFEVFLVPSNKLGAEVPVAALLQPELAEDSARAAPSHRLALQLQSALSIEKGS